MVADSQWSGAGLEQLVEWTVSWRSSIHKYQLEELYRIIKKEYQLLMAAATPNPSRGLFRVLGEWQKRLQGEKGMLFKVSRASVGVDAKSDILFTNQS